MAPISLIQQDKDVSPILLTLVDQPSLCADVVSSPSPTATHFVVDYPPFQCPDLGSTTIVNRSTDFVVQDIGEEGHSPPINKDEEEPVSILAAYLSILLSFALLCTILILYLIYVSHLGKR